MAYDIVRNHWKYQTSWTNGFTCTHVKLQPKPVTTSNFTSQRNVPQKIRSQSTSPVPKRRTGSRPISRTSTSPEPRRNDSRPVSKTCKRRKDPKTPFELLDDRREQRANRRRPWTEKLSPKRNNKNTYIETYYESCLPPDVDLDEIKLHSRKFVANSRYGNIYQIRTEIKNKDADEKHEETPTWLWEGDYKVWLRDAQNTLSDRSSPVVPTYRSVQGVKKGVNLDHRITRTKDGYYSINTKPKSKPGSAGSTPRMGQSITDKPNPELFAHFNAYRLTKQERKEAAIRIQSLVRGFLVRAKLYRMKRKVVLDHGKSWTNFIKEYKELIARVQSRYGVMRHSCPLVLKQVEEFIDVKCKYEKEFHTLASRRQQKLPKEFLTQFFKSCDLHPTKQDLSKAFDKIFEGKGNVAEVVFVLDCSTSVGPVGFRCLIQFVKDVISMLEVGPDRVRVGVLPFNEDIYQSFNITTYSTKHDILNAIDSIRLKHGLTRTDLAIKEMNNMLMNSRPGVKKIGVVVTDGKSSQPKFTEWETNRAHNDGINVYAIGVGENADKNELLTIASSVKHVHTVVGYKDLSNLTFEIAEATRSEKFTGIGDNTFKTGKCRPLTREECMEILWTLYPPEAANLAHVRKSRWVRPIIQGTEAWSLMDKKTEEATNLAKCLSFVVKSRIERNGYVMMPSLDNKYGVDHITNVDEAVSRIQDWIKDNQVEANVNELQDETC